MKSWCSNYRTDLFEIDVFRKLMIRHWWQTNFSLFSKKYIFNKKGWHAKGKYVIYVRLASGSGSTWSSVLALSLHSSGSYCFLENPFLTSGFNYVHQSDPAIPFKLCRRQFPIKIAFAVAVFQAKRRTVKRVAICLLLSFFFLPHGHAFFQACSFDNVALTVIEGHP